MTNKKHVDSFHIYDLNIFEDDLEHYEDYEAEVDEISDWEEQSILNEFDENYVKQLPEKLDFFCKEVDQCKSFQHFGFKCRCVRKQIAAEDVEWLANKYLSEVKGRITNVFAKYRSNND